MTAPDSAMARLWKILDEQLPYSTPKRRAFVAALRDLEAERDEERAREAGDLREVLAKLRTEHVAEVAPLRAALLRIVEAHRQYNRIDLCNDRDALDRAIADAAKLVGQ